MSMKYDFALIAIGDEITDGDITNTNTMNFATFLSQKHLNIGSHISCRDDIDDICSSISFLATNHQNIMVIGGLGPTEDDLTTEAVARYLEKELFTDEKSWDILKKRMMQKYNRIPTNVKKQAMFPEDANIITNNNGTANGFRVQFDTDRFIYVFPGPPKECILMLEQLDFAKKSQSKKIIRKSWNVYNIGESLLAEKLNQIKDEYSFVTFKYRISDGFIELKYFYPDYCLHSDNIIKMIENLLQENLKN